ncbi:MAG: tetratricopeptide repeat protein [Saprospiraceae bacterium]|nr:tetratricopeptide repeat protein [Saprospiraceae bacterium]
MPPLHTQKNIVNGTIIAGGNVHIGDNIYNIERDFKSGSILFLRLDKKDEHHYTAQLSVKSKHSTQGTLATSGEKWCENIEVNIPAQLFEALNDFQAFRRGIDTQMRLTGTRDVNPSSIITLENQLAQLIFDTFFAGDIGKACTDFIQLLEEQRIEELLLAVSADDERIVNLPFEMVLPLLFPPKLGEAKKSLAINNFGLVRTKMTALDTFKMQGDHATAAPLKMLFITALPENLDERGKMLQIEEEQTRLIQSIGALEATGDKQPKIVIEFLENASLDELNKALHARQHDIVHISGHGAYHAAAHKGVLYFENEDGDEEQVSGAALGETLRQHACVKLLILSACETAIVGSEGGVTEQVAEFGVPSIVAMRFAVTDEGAKVFTTELYTQLAKGLSLTRALAYAREALLKEIERKREQTPQILHIAEWFTPVVYQNQLVGALIDKTQPYHLPDHFYPLSSFLKTSKSRLIGEGFIGRKRYLIQLRQAFRAGRHICLHGLGGLGKTTLAEAFAHNYDNHSHAIVIFRNGNQINEAHILDTLNKRFAKTNPDLAEQIQQALDDPQTDVLHKLQLLIDNYLHGRKTILIFDNVEDVQMDEGGAYQRSIGSESLSAFLRHLCENTPINCHILFTTRYKIANLADMVEHLALDKMGYAEQYRLLNYSPILRDIPLQDRDEVYKRLDGHPRGYEYLEALLKKDKTFSWQQVSAAEADVFENLLLAKVYERLTEHEKAMFQMVAVFIARTPLEALTAVSGETEADLLPVLKALQDWSLCFLEKDGRFEVHRLTREWMREHVISTLNVKEWALKAGEYFKEQPTWGDEILAKDYFEIAEDWQRFAITSFGIQNHYQLIGLYPQAFELNQAVLDKNVEERSIAPALFNMGTIFNLFGQNDQALALYEQSLAINKKIGDRKGEGATLSNISQIYDTKGDYDTAMRYLEQSLAIQQQIGDRQGEGTTLNNISQIHKIRGDYDTALRHLEQSLAIVQQIGDRKGEGVILNNTSQIHKIKGDYDTALRYLEQSLAIRQQIGDRYGESVTLNNISQIYSAKGDYDTALRYLEKSLIISQQIGDRNGEGVTLNNISQIYDAKGDYDTALRYLEQSLAIQQQIGDIYGVAINFTNMGVMLFDQNRLEEAIPLLMQAYRIFQKIGSPDVKSAINYLGAIFKRIGEAKFKEILSKME